MKKTTHTKEELEVLIKMNEKSLLRISESSCRVNIFERLAKYYKIKNEMIKESKYNWCFVFRKSKMGA